MVVFNPLKFWGGDAQRKTVDSLWLWHISMGTKLPTEAPPSWVLGMVVLCAQVLGPYRGWPPRHRSVQSSVWGFRFLQGLEVCVYLAPASFPPSCPPHCFVSGWSPSCPADPLGQGLPRSVALKE